MLRTRAYPSGLVIDRAASCDFATLESVSNEEVLVRSGRVAKDKLLRFLATEMGIERRYVVRERTNALDLARDALSRLLALSPELRDDAEFLIYAGISNPMPTTCLAALLSNEFGFGRASAWDLKSGCSTAVLALAQAADWFQHGAKRGVIVSAETFSKFTSVGALEMAASTGDGACAVAVSASLDWKIRGVVHGTDARLFKSAYVPGTYPVDIETYRKEDYLFAFDNKPEALAVLGRHWVDSLRDLLALSEIAPERVTHYVAHQVDASKNHAIATACGIREPAIAKNFAGFGNMGAPTVLLNYLARTAASAPFEVGDVLVFHVVGGGVSYAGMCLEKVQ